MLPTDLRDRVLERLGFSEAPLVTVDGLNVAVAPLGTPLAVSTSVAMPIAMLRARLPKPTGGGASSVRSSGAMSTTCVA